MWMYSYDEVVSMGRRASDRVGWHMTRAGGKGGGGDTRQGRRPIDVGGTCRSGPGMRGRRPECGRGLSTAAVAQRGGVASQHR